jgi:hypothetical protein
MVFVSKLRLVALLCSGALAVHELRYLAGYGGAADEALSDHGHAYLAAVMPLLALLLAALFGHFMWGLAGRREGGWSAGRCTTALAFAGALLAIYTGQELVEGLLAPGHPEGLDGVFGHGGWLAVPFSALVGGALSLLVRGARRVVEAVQRLGRVQVFVAAPPPAALAAAAPLLVLPAPLARLGAGRAPPLFAS